MTRTAAWMLVWIVGMTGPVSIAGLYAITKTAWLAIIMGGIASAFCSLLYGYVLQTKIGQYEQATKGSEG